MIKLNFLHICDEVIASIDGKMSIIGIFDAINSKDFPTVHPKFFVLTSISNDPGSYTQTVEIISPDDEVIAKVDGKAVIVKEGGKNNFIAGFVNAKFPKEGKYWIKAVVDGEVITNKDDHFFNLLKKDN